MLSTDFASPADICRDVSSRARDARLAVNRSQAGLAERAGVSLGSLKRFERTGAASLEFLARIAVALRLEARFGELFQRAQFASLDPSA